MEKVLSIYFNTDRTYITKVIHNPEGLELDYINSTTSPIDIESIHLDPSLSILRDIEIILDKIPNDYEKINIIFPADSIMIAQMPSKLDIKKEEIVDLVSLEIKKFYPNLNITNFEIQVFQLPVSQSQSFSQIAIIIQKSDIDFFNGFFKKYNKKINFTYASQIAAANAFLYNYPELVEKYSVIAGAQNNYLDITILKNNQLVYLGLVNYQNTAEIPELLEQEINKLMGSVVPELNGGLFYYGNDINKEVSMALWEISMLLGLEGKRLNAFRMIKTQLDARDREYLSRTLQIYPSCIGGTIPPYFNYLII